MKKPMEKIAQDVKAALADIKLPDDYYWRFGGGYQDLMANKGQSLWALLLTLCLVYMVMACLFENYLYPLLIMIKIPLNFIGIWLALWITHKPLSTQAVIGMIMLAGYSVNAAILLVDHALHLPEQQSKAERFIQAGVDRLRPILMTAIAAILGFLPMALSFGQASDLWSALAVTIIGGLISSTILILFVLPALVISTDDIQVFLKSIIKSIMHKARLPMTKPTTQNL
jgi:HAE1 family hydrophobic/amphiphilic exporter-1